MNGTELITTERKRQIEKEGWTAEHDDSHTQGELALMAALYATPIQLWWEDDLERGSYSFVDPYLWLCWDNEWDKRIRSSGGELIPNGQLPKDQRIRNLVKAGALIVAEIDRLQRLEKNGQ